MGAIHRNRLIAEDLRRKHNLTPDEHTAPNSFNVLKLPCISTMLEFQWYQRTQARVMQVNMRKLRLQSAQHVQSATIW